MIFFESVSRVAYRTDNPLTQVAPSTDVVKNNGFARVEEQGINREIPPEGVFLFAGEFDVCGTAPVKVGSVFSECGHLEAAFRLHHDLHTERGAHVITSAEQPFHVLGTGVGGNVVIFGLDSQNEVAHAASGQQRAKARLRKPLTYPYGRRPLRVRGGRDLPRFHGVHPGFWRAVENTPRR